MSLYEANYDEEGSPKKLLILVLHISLVALVFFFFFGQSLVALVDPILSIPFIFNAL